MTLRSTTEDLQWMYCDDYIHWDYIQVYVYCEGIFAWPGGRLETDPQNTVSRLQPSYVGGGAAGCRLSWRIPLRQDYPRETPERRSSVSNLYVLIKAASIDPEGRS